MIFPHPPEGKTLRGFFFRGEEKALKLWAEDRKNIVIPEDRRYN